MVVFMLASIAIGMTVGIAIDAVVRGSSANDLKA
jgi:hypothetical protein